MRTRMSASLIPGLFFAAPLRDSFWKKHNLRTDEADLQWKQLLQSLGVEITGMDDVPRRSNRGARCVA